MKDYNKRTGAVLVLYKPDWKVTEKAIESLRNQVDRLCIVDNTPGVDLSDKFYDDSIISYIPLGDNLGIAKAQNTGIQHLIDEGFDYILFSDQDSQAPGDVVEKLVSAHHTLTDNGVKVAAVGTRAINKQTGKPYAAKSKELGSPLEVPDRNFTECYSVRSSISLISKEAFLNVGGFDEALFIDGVDHEWGWRAWHRHKLRSFIVENATISHMLGEGDRSFAGKSLSIPSYARTYFQFRNFFWLKKRDYIPSSWIKENGIKYFIKTFYFPLMVAPRAKFLHNIVKGIKDGLFPSVQTEYWPYFQVKKD